MLRIGTALFCSYLALTGCSKDEDPCEQVCSCVCDGQSDCSGPCNEQCESKVAAASNPRAACESNPYVTGAGCADECSNFSGSNNNTSNFIDPATDPDGVLSGLTVQGGTRRSGAPPTSTGSGAPVIANTGGSLTVTAGQSLSVPLTFSGTSPYSSCIVTVDGADGYIEVPDTSGQETLEGTATLVIEVSSNIGSGSWTCVYGVTDSSGGVSDYVDSPVTTDNPKDDGQEGEAEGEDVCGDSLCSPSEESSGSCPGDCPENSCCVETNGCPGETGSGCGTDCCCCGGGQWCGGTDHCVNWE